MDSYLVRASKEYLTGRLDLIKLLKLQKEKENKVIDYNDTVLRSMNIYLNILYFIDNFLKF